MDNGDILMYADATVVQIKSLAPIFDITKKNNIAAFTINDGKGDERDATKRDTFVLMGCDDKKYWSGQLNASHMFFIKNDFTVQFVKEWLMYAEDERIITEKENTQGLPNYDIFVAHRHDQSIYSLLVKKYNIPTYVDITQYGNPFRSSEEYWGQLLVHQR